jgi:hypothetical protein
MKRWTQAIALVTTTLTLAVVGGAPHALADTTRLTGRTCDNYYTIGLDGSQQLLGSRCAQARIHYVSDGTLWHITTYDMKYTVSGPLSYGANNNENPFKIDGGFEGGTQTWLSADSGSANVGWFNRSGYPNGYSYKGESHISIHAYADIPSAGDPDLKLQTSTW